MQTSSTISLLVLCLAVVIGFTEAVCRDKVKGCKRAEKYCKWPSLAGTLKDNCKDTCNHCTPQERKESARRPAPHKKNPPKHNSPKRKPPVKYPNYVLHYFAFRFRGEPARLLFHYKDVKFTDNRILPADFPKVKKDLPNGQVPLLQIDNHNLTQSNSIYRYLARKFDLLGKSEVEIAYLDQVSELFREMIDATTPFVQVSIGARPGDKKDLYDNQFIPALEKYGPQMEAFLDKSTSGFFGSSVSWVDFYVTDSILTFKGYAPKTMEKFQKLLDHQELVYSLPQLKSYIASRPESPI